MIDPIPEGYKAFQTDTRTRKKKKSQIINFSLQNSDQAVHSLSHSNWKQINILE